MMNRNLKTVLELKTGINPFGATAELVVTDPTIMRLINDHFDTSPLSGLGAEIEKKTTYKSETWTISMSMIGLMSLLKDTDTMKKLMQCVTINDGTLADYAKLDK